MCFWIQVPFQKPLNANPVYQINLLGLWIWWWQMRGKNTHEWRMCMVFFVNKLANIWLRNVDALRFRSKTKGRPRWKTDSIYIFIFSFWNILNQKKKKGKNKRKYPQWNFLWVQSQKALHTSESISSELVRVKEGDGKNKAPCLFRIASVL